MARETVSKCYLAGLVKYQPNLVTLPPRNADRNVPVVTQAFIPGIC